MPVMPQHTPIDRADSSHKERIVELRPSRHTHKSIYQLPYELLLAVFVEVQRGSRLLEWHHITHVCKTWRAVGIGSPKLWTKLAPTKHNHDYMVLHIIRSGTMPLDISVSDTLLEATFILLLAMMPRVRSIRMWYPAPISYMNIFQSILLAHGQFASHLEILSICGESVTHGTPDHFKLWPTTLSGAVHLRDLTLFNMTIDWNIFPFNRCTALSLGGVMTLHRVSWREFLDTLSKMPLLENLCVDIGHLRLAPPDENLSRVTLEHVWKLSVLEVELHEIPYLVSYLSTPKVRDLSVSWSCTEDETDTSGIIDTNLAATMESFSAWIPQADFGPFKDVRVTIGNRSLTIDFGTPKRTFFFGVMDHLYCQFDAQHFEEFFSGLSPLHEAEIVEVVLDCTFASAEDLVDLFGHFPRLTSIVALPNSAEAVIQSLRPVLPISRDAVGHLGIPFAQVQSLTLLEEQEYSKHTPQMWPSLQEVLMLRRQYSLYMQHLSVGYVHRDSVEQLMDLKAVDNIIFMDSKERLSFEIWETHTRDYEDVEGKYMHRVSGS